MIDIIYRNSLLKSPNLILDDKLKKILKYSTLPEDFHPFAFNEGILIITDGNENSLVIKPSCGLTDLYYLISFIIENKSELSYCVEEFFTSSEYDDEYCISINKFIKEDEDYLEIKNNNQSNSCFFNFNIFCRSLLESSTEIIDLYASLEFENNEIPFVNLMRNKIEDLKIFC